MRLGKLCGNGPEAWANLQRTYDLYYAQQELAEEIKKNPDVERGLGSRHAEGNKGGAMSLVQVKSQSATACHPQRHRGDALPPDAITCLGMNRRNPPNFCTLRRIGPRDFFCAPLMHSGTEMKKLTYAFIACFALAAAPASAANINVSATIDLYPTIKYLSPLDHPVTLNVGDTVTYNVTFADNKAFQINGTNGPNNDFVSFWMAAASGTSADWTINNVSVQLHGFQTNAGIANPLTVAGQVPGGNIAIGPNFYFQDLDAGEYLSFSGFSVSFVITSLVKANTNIATSNVVYDRAWFVSSPNHSVIDAPSAVPLPAALPLFASGLGLMGLATWRRKRKAPKAAA